MENRIKNEWGYNIYFASYTTNSRGVAILVNNNVEYKLLNIFKDAGGNYVFIHVSMFEKEFLIGSVYGPNDDNPDFYENLEAVILQSNQFDNIILGGDWNLVMDFDLDCFNYVRRNNPEASKQLVELSNNLNLLDIFREMYPEVRRYTWRRANPIQQSRLDYFLISDLLSPSVSKVDISPGYRTDHSLVIITLEFEKDEKRINFWKFNTSLLKDSSYLTEINTLISDIIKEFAVSPYNKENLENIPLSDITFSVSDQIFLDYLLMKIRSKTISYAAWKNKSLTENETKLKEEIAKIHSSGITNDTINNTLLELENELKQLREIRLKGVLIRSRARWVEEGEKVSAYFCSLEKRHFTNKSMNKLESQNGSILSDKTEILNEVRSFYETLYSEREVEDINIDALVGEMPSLNDLESDQLEGELSLEEISLALKDMKNGKSPGTDGFQAEFFKVFWKKLGPFVLRSLNEGFRNGELSVSQKEGIIICIPKPDKSKDKIKNWRPISLLNIVYKIGSSSIANRIKPLLNKLIHENQTGFIKGRYIGDNVRLIYDLMDYLDKNEKPGLLMCLDFEKAFDSLSLKFLEKVLISFGFKRDIITWIKVFYNNIKSTVSLNGNISKWFQIKRGCRQGDPISPYLFILCVEIMALMIRQNNDIKGITIRNTEYKIAQFADDSEIMLAGDRISFENTIQTIDRFGDVSGLKLNLNKTNVTWLGSKRNSDIRYMQHLDFTWNPRKFKILGIWFSNDLSECIELNFKDKLLEMKQLYAIWSKRQITPLGRVAILKSLVLSKLTYLWLLLPNPPDPLILEIQKFVFKFIWTGKPDKVSRKTSTRCERKGGMNIPDVNIFMKSLKLAWIKKSLEQHLWSDILLSSNEDMQNLKIFGTNIRITPYTNDFWVDVIKSYKMFGACITIENSESFLAEPLFYNENIKIDSKCLFFENWFEKGVVRVKNFVDNNGNFLTFNEFNTKYNLNEINFLKFMGCRNAVISYKRKCNIIIENDISAENNNVIEKIISTPRGSKAFYEALLDTESNPNFCNKWEEKLLIEIDWKNVFDEIHCIKEIKLKWFQMRILYRILGTNIVLKCMNIRQDDNCTFCANSRESIIHMFMQCDIVKVFWNDFKNRLRAYNLIDNDFEFDSVLILFGHKKNCNNILKYAICIAKYFIYKCRCENSSPTINAFIKYFKYKYQTQQQIAKNGLVMDRFNQLWEDWTGFLD